MRCDRLIGWLLRCLWAEGTLLTSFNHASSSILRFVEQFYLFYFKVNILVILTFKYGVIFSNTQMC